MFVSFILSGRRQSGGGGEFVGVDSSRRLPRRRSAEAPAAHNFVRSSDALARHGRLLLSCALPDNANALPVNLCGPRAIANCLSRWLSARRPRAKPFQVHEQLRSSAGRAAALASLAAANYAGRETRQRHGQVAKSLLAFC